MNLFEAAVLGLVQGLTEFLPISSTAHLRVVPELLGWEDPGAAFSAVIQLGTVLAVVLYFWRDVYRLLGALASGLKNRRPLETFDARLAWCLVLGTVPICILGLLLKPLIEGGLRSLYVVASSLIALALVLWGAERWASHRRVLTEVTFRDALVVGGWQALALVPGSSRSGTTLTGGLLLGLKREDAARFSFLLSIPATGLAGLFELKHLLEAQTRPSTAALLVGTGVAFVSGMAAIAGLLRFLRTRTTAVFIVYRLALGLLLFVLLGRGVIRPMSGVENLAPESVPREVPVSKQATD